MNSHMLRRIISISCHYEDDIEYQLLYVQDDFGDVASIWSEAEEHIYNVGDMVELGLRVNNGRLSLHVVYP